MKNIVFIGKMGSGKTIAANWLVIKYGHIKLGFGDAVKEIAVNEFGMGSKDRKLLQTIGRVGRAIDSNVWINKLVAKIEAGNNYVVDDCRFKNELDALTKLNFIPIFIESDLGTRVLRLFNNYGYIDNSELNDVSENGIDAYSLRECGVEPFKMCVIKNNGYISALYKGIDIVLQESDSLC